MSKDKFIKTIFTLLLLVTTVFFVNALPGYSSTHPDIQAKQKQTRQKINYLKWLENLETNKLYKNQQKLEATSTDLKTSKIQYSTAQNKLTDLERNLSRALSDFSDIDFQMKRRIRQIYKHQRKGFFELLLLAQDFNTFLDRLYFEGLVIRNDYRRMRLARQKAREIALFKYNIEEQKRYLARSIKNINYKQQSIQNAISRNQNMINKLRTDRGTYERAERELAKQSASLQSMISRSARDSRISVVSGFIKPIGGRITSPFGWRTHPIFKSRSFHSGVDIGGPYNGNVRASNAGKVIYSGWYGGYGKVVILDHGDVNGIPTTTLYAHLNSARVSPGEYVSKGQVVGYEGTTGYSTGPHVHFEVRVNGRPNNPLNYI
ncbi:MAG: peptidoglycan DD-metalloendopeptidase family protein [Candidatus Gastranaerophilales bacterium]|nr:peptidoglycan DD-metalloendopeptidase family protein [Candidatus Gastranaerophilales bacterium]